MCQASDRLLAATAIIGNTEPRRDAQGEILDAHDGCLEYFEGRFYLYGTRYGKTDGFGNENRYVCYSSSDLTAWTAHGEMLKDASPRTYYRPYVKHNQKSGKYVMWYNADKTFDKTLPIEGQVFEVDGRTAFMIPPKQRPAGRAAPWVWYAPTLPGLPGPEERWMFEKLLAAGIAIGGVDVAESYGSPNGCAVFSAFHKELVEKRGMSPRACLLARSRGGLMLYNWAAEHPDSVACIAGIYPVCNLASYPGLARACGAYGLTEAELTAQLTRHNPIARLTPLAKAKVPIFHIHGDVDDVVPLKDNSGEVARRYRELGGPIELVVPPGQGHNMWQGFFQCQELVDFLIKQANAEAQRK